MKHYQSSRERSQINSGYDGSKFDDVLFAVLDNHLLDIFQRIFIACD